MSRWSRPSVVVAAVLFCCASAHSQAKSPTGEVHLSSPDQQLVVRFSIQPDKASTASAGRLVYSVTFHGKSLVEPSALGLELEGQPDLGNDVQIASATQASGTDDYVRVAGKTSSVHDRYNSVAIHVAEPSGPARSMIVEARAYNGAVAFRYIMPKQNTLRDFRLAKEDTEFQISKDATTWALELPNFRSMYEAEYIRLPISALSNQGGVASHILVGLPLLMHVPGVAWMAIAEADLEGNSALYVTTGSSSWQYHDLVATLSPRFDQPGLAVIGALPHHSAWRVLLVGDQPGDLIESNAIADLNPPNALIDTSWIHPGKVSWDWWSGDLNPQGEREFTTKNMEYYVDFAAQSGFPYMLLDAGWSPRDDIMTMRGNVDVPELVRYAASKGVKVWIWIDAKPTAMQMKTAFPLYEKWGVAGLKIDFVSRDDQQGIQFYYDVVREAAAHHLMVDFHGATKPWGLDRTFPNLLGFEAVVGMEHSKAGARDNPIHRTTIPFTRMLTGPMDYTPGGFDNVTEDAFVAHNIHPVVMGTRAQQLALYVVYRSPFEMVSDAPSAYANQPAFQFIREVPVTWDRTRVLNGRPGEFITIARQHGSNWYLGSITNWDAREIHVPLSFLGSGSYTAEIYEDAADAARNPKHVSIRKQTVHAGEALTLHLAPGGGCAIRFVPAR